jgi:predicted permease
MRQERIWLRLARLVLRMAARILPRSLRQDWLHEWDSELIYLSRRQSGRNDTGRRQRGELAQHTAGALVDAAWLRRQCTSDAELVQDMRYGARLLRRHVGFSLSAISILALGIGATTAIFTVVNAVLLEPLPYRDPDRLALMWERNTTIGKERDSVAPLNYLDWKAQNVTFEGLAAFRFGRFVLTGIGEAEEIVNVAVRGDLFRVLGVNASLGRTFTESEERRDERVVVLTHEFWQRHFGGDRTIVGRTLTLTGRSYTIVGVMPPAFRFPEGTVVDVYSPLIFTRDDLQGRRAHSLTVIGRLKDGVTLQAATLNLAAIAAAIASHDQGSNPEVAVVNVHEVLVENVRLSILVLFATVGVVLLIACVNVANLLLGRGLSRYREIAIRSALGGDRFRLIRQLLTESVMLALLGGALGTLIAVWGMSILKQFVPPDLPRIENVRLDVTVLLFAAAAATMTGILFGLAPAAQLARSSQMESVLLRSSTVNVSPAFRRNRSRAGLVIAEVALSTILLAAAGLMARSFLAVRNLDFGFQPHNLLTFQISLPNSRYPGDPAQFRPLPSGTSPVQPSKLATFFLQILDRIATVPGVLSAAAVSALPLNPVGIDYDMPIVIEGKPLARAGEEPQADLRVATDDYFSVMGIDLACGRYFTESDGPGGVPVIIINDTLARQTFGGENPIGQRLRLYGRSRQIVGVVESVRHYGYSTTPRPEMFLPFRQFQFSTMTIVVRSAADSAALGPSIRKLVGALDPGLPVTRMRPMAAYLSDSVSRLRFTTVLLATFACLALVLSVVGVYGVMAHSVGQRAREIGVRMAMGANRSDVLRMIVGEGLALAIAGVLIGLAGATLATRLMSKLLFGVNAADLTTFGAAAVVLVIASLAATYIPARRATHLDPVLVLKTE